MSNFSNDAVTVRTYTFPQSFRLVIPFPVVINYTYVCVYPYTCVSYTTTAFYDLFLPQEDNHVSQPLLHRNTK